ncbi:thioredoxin fold domain-containing protein [Niabella sp. CJ426]|uniref:thioredoxin family protein n=1 Tax=Niabella sp. CJ426 TaxID=3393740 RepID=UPI003CFC9441
MKKKVLGILVGVITLVTAKAQEGEGIRFENGLSWEQVKSKARAENKYIFIDSYTTWCGYCSYMSKNVFNQKAAGDFFNKNFISLKLQMDSTENDSEAVKASYADAQYIREKYEVTSFPTFLFFNPEGKAMHRIVGATQSTEEFVTLSADALDSNKQYYVVVEKIAKGGASTQQLKEGAKIALVNNDFENTAILFNQYLLAEKNIFTKENLEYASWFVKTGKGFELFLNNTDKIDAIVGKGFSDSLVMPIIAKEEVYAKIKPSESAPDWEILQGEIIKKYPVKKQQIERMIAWAKVNFYKTSQEWNKYALSADEYITKYGEYAAAPRLNNMAINVLTNSNDQSYLDKAINWSKRSMLEDSKNAEYVSTYAKLLYKTKQNKEAIIYQQKALKLAPSEDEQKHAAILDKMKKEEMIL